MDAAAAAPVDAAEAARLKQEVRRLTAAQAEARQDVRLQALAGALGGFVIGRQTGVAFLPRFITPVGVRSLRMLPSAWLGLAGMLVGAGGMAGVAVRERSYLWDPAEWSEALQRRMAAGQQRGSAARAPHA